MKNSFDDSIRKKWESMEFPVNPSHREDMIRLLDQNKRRRPLLFWWLGIFGTIVLMSAIILVVNYNSVPKSNEPDKKHEQSPMPGSTDDLAKIESGENPSDNSQHKLSNVTESVEENPSQKPVTSNVKPPSVTNSIISQQNNKAKDIKSLPGSSSNTSTPSAKSSSEKPSAVKQSATSTSNEAISNPMAVNNVVDLKKQTTNPGLDKINISSTGAVDDGGVAASEVHSNAAAQNDIISPNNNLQETYITDPVGALLMDGIAYQNEASAPHVETTIRKPHPISVFAETGISYVPSPGGLTTSGIAFRGGAGVGYLLTGKTYISLSGGYMQQQDGFRFQKSSTVNRPGFGARSDFHTLTPDQLHFVYAGIGVQQRINRHIISAGGGAQYLYGAKGDIVINTNDQIAGASSSSTYAWLNLDGMQRWLWNGEVAYGYQLMPRLSVHAGTRFYFTSIRKEDEILESKGYYWYGKLSGFQPFLSLKYHIYGKR